MTLGLNNLDEDQHRYIRLWVAVMVSGIRDAANNQHIGLQWVISESSHVGSFRWICEEALHIDPDSMLRQALKNMGSLKRLSKSLLKEAY